MSYVGTTVGRLFVVLWTETTLSDLDRLRREILEFRRNSGQKIVYASISDAHTPPPGDRERKALVAMAEELMDNFEAIYMVLRADGFRGSVLRSAMAGMMLVSKVRKQVFVVATIEEVLHREGARLGVDASTVRRQLAKDGLLLPREMDPQ